MNGTKELRPYCRDEKRDFELAITALRDQLAREKNEPLTWKELKSMEGNPVYLVVLGEPDQTMWAIALNTYDQNGHEFIKLASKIYHDNGCGDLYGKTWRAYRYEPKGERE